MKYQNLSLLFLLAACAHNQSNKTVDLASIHCSKDNYKKSLHDFTAKIMETPDASAPLYELSRCYYESEDYHRSLYFIDMALNKEKRPGYINLKGKSQFHLGRIEQSVKSFEEVLKLEPQNEWAQVNLGMSFFAQGKNKEAETLFSKITDSDIRKHLSFLLTQYRLSLGSNDKNRIVKDYEVLPENYQADFQWKLPYAKIVMAELNDESRLKMLADLRSSSKGLPHNMKEVEDLARAFPLRTPSAESKE